nr:uncharacterized protein LOC112035769 [Quercus suber]
MADYGLKDERYATNLFPYCSHEEKPTMVIKEMQEEVDWVNYMDAEAMKTMMKMSGDVFNITNEEPMPPQHGKPLFLYLSIIRDAVGSTLAQEDDEKNEKAIYYLSKRFRDYETRNTPIEKSCFALLWAIQKLRHIILPFQIWVVVRMDLLKYLFEKPALRERLSRWLILLAKFDLKYMARKTIKGCVMSDFCAENPIKGEDGKKDFLDEDILDVELGTWKMYFDEVVNQYGNVIGILLITPKGSYMPLAIKLNFEAINNMTEYEACIAGMKAL